MHVQSFGKFVDYNVWDNVVLSANDIDIIKKTINYINRTEGHNIDVFARIGTPHEENKLYVKFKSMPRLEDFEKLKKANPDAQQDDYKRHSKWMPLDKTLLYNSLEYLHAQNGYIYYCLKHPDHIRTPKAGYGKPQFEKSC